MRTVVGIILGLTLLGGWWLPPAWGSTYYVANNGSDSNPCTEAQPCARVQHVATTRMTGGDTVYLRTGTYGEQINRATGLPSGTGEGSRTTVAGYPGERPVLTGGVDLFYDPDVGSGDQSLSYVTFDNLKVDGPQGFGVLGRNAHHIRFSNSERTGGQSGAGVGSGYGSHHLEFINLDVHHNGFSRANDHSGNPGTPGGHGFYICGKFNVVRGCDIHDNGNYGLQIYDSHNIGCADDTVVEDNSIHDNHTGDGAATINYGSRVRIVRNKVWNNQGDGIAVSYGNPDGVLFCGNTITDNTGTAISIGTGVTNTVLKGNVLRGNSREMDDRGSGTRHEDGGAGDCPAPAPGSSPTLGPQAKPKFPAPKNLRVLVQP